MQNNPLMELRKIVSIKKVKAPKIKESNKERNERIKKQNLIDEIKRNYFSKEISPFSDKKCIESHEKRKEKVNNCSQKESCLDYALDYKLQDNVLGGGINWNLITHYHDQEGNQYKLPEDFDYKDLKIFNS